MRKLGIWVSVVLAIASLYLFTQQSVLIPNNTFLNFVSGIVGLTLSAGVGYLVSYNQIKKELSDENDKITSHDRQRLAEITAKSASELNDLYNNIQTFEDTWEHFVENTPDVNPTLAISISNTIANMKTIVQSTTNKIIYISTDGTKFKGKENPYGLFNYQDRVKCSTFTCKNDLDCSSVPSYHRATGHIFCEHCKRLTMVKRDFDGSLISRQSYLNKGIESGATHDEKPHIEITCPNSSCATKIEVEAPPYLDKVNRGCYECRSSFEVDMKTKIAKLIENKNSAELGVADFVSGQRTCGCGTVNKIKNIKTNGLGQNVLMCHICGAMHLIGES